MGQQMGVTLRRTQGIVWEILVLHNKKLCVKNEIIMQIKVRFKILFLVFTIKILITLVEKALLLKVVLFIGDGNFISILVFRS